MLLRRILMTPTSQYFLRQLFATTRTSTRRQPYNDIRSTILNTRSFDDLTELFKQKGQSISGLVVCQTGKHISGLVSDSRNTVTWDKVAVLIKALNQIDLSQLEIKNIVSLLGIVRGIYNRKQFSKELDTVKSALIARLLAVLKETRVDSQDLQDLLNAYFQFAQLKITKQTRILCQKIIAVAGNGRDIDLEASQAGYLLYSISCRSQLYHLERVLRKKALQVLSKQKTELTQFDLIRIVRSLAKMDKLDFDFQERMISNDFTELLLNKIHLLQEKDLLNLLRKDDSVQLNGMNKIFVSVFESLCETINGEGMSELNINMTFKVFSHLSAHIRLKANKQQFQNKFMSFLNYYIKKTSQGTVNASTIGRNINELLKGDFFSSQHEQQFVSIVKNNNVNLNLTAFYLLQSRGISITSFQNQISKIDLETINPNGCIYLGIAIHKYIETNQQFARIFKTIHARVQATISTIPQFINFYRDIKKGSRLDGFNANSFDRAFGDIFNNLPNPCQVNPQSEQSFTYKVSYVTYILDARSKKDARAFMQKYNQSINFKEIAKICQFQCLNFDNKRPNTQLLYWFQRRLKELNDVENRLGVFTLLDLLGRYSQFVIQPSQIDIAETDVAFRMLNLFVNMVQTRPEFSDYISNIMEKYLVKNFGNYSVENNYRNLVNHLLQKMKHFSKKNHFIVLLLENGLRLNLVKRQHLQQINLENYFLSAYEKQRLKAIKDSQYVPSIRGVNKNAILSLLSTPNTSAYFEENFDEAIEAIRTFSPYQLVSALVNFSLEKKKKGWLILREILNQTIDKVTYIQKTDLIGICSNAVDNAYFTSRQYRQITQNIISGLAKDMRSVSFFSHLEVLKLILAQNGLQGKPYFQALMNKYRKEKQFYQSLFLRLANIHSSFPDADLDEIPTLIRDNVSMGLKLFLLLENSLSEERKHNLAQEIVTALRANKSINLLDIQWKYFSKKYAAHVGDLTIQDTNLTPYNLSSKGNSQQILKKISEATGKTLETIHLNSSSDLHKLDRFVFIFNNSKRISAYNESQLYRRLIPAVIGQDVTVIVLGQNNFRFNLQQINTNCEGLMTAQQFESIASTLPQRKTKREKGQQEAEL